MSEAQRVQDLLIRFQQARSRGMLWNSLLQRCYQYAIPDRNLYNYATEGAQKNGQVYDTTAVDAVISFTSKLQSSLTPPFGKWAQLQAGADIPPENKDEADKILEKATDIVFRYIHNSNFDLVSNEAYFDLAIGTAAIMCNEGDDDQPLMFSSVPLEQLFPEEGPNGTIESVWRYYENMQVNNIQRHWPEAKMPQVLYEQLKDGRMCKCNIVEGTIYDPKKKVYTTIILEPSAQEILMEREDKVSPWIVFRWSRVGSEIYGRGPVIFALPSILSLNKVAEFELKSAAMAVSPPYMAYQDGVVNPYSIKIQPNSIIAVSRGQAGQWPLQPLPTNPNYQFSQLLANDLRQQINNLLFTQPLGEVDAPAKTATEITYRQQALAEKIGPAFGRLQVEYLSKVIDRVVYILKKKGLFPNLVIDGKDVGVKYVSPLARAQQQSEVAGFQQFFGLLQSFVGPEMAVLGINEAKLPKWLADKIGVDLELVKTEQQIEGMKQALRDQQQAQMEAEQAQQQGVEQ